MAAVSPVTVPPLLVPVLPYVAIAGLIAQVVLVTVVGPPAWLYVVVAVFTALGALGTSNSSIVKPPVSDVPAAVPAAVEPEPPAGPGSPSVPETPAAATPGSSDYGMLLAAYVAVAVKALEASEARQT